MQTFLNATISFLRTRSRVEKFNSCLTQWRYVNSPVLSPVYLVELFPNLRNKAVAVPCDIGNSWELPYGERLVLAAIVRALTPRVIFEIGTYSGSTTKLLADSMDQPGVVHTLDLPAEDLGSVANEIGACFQDKTEYEHVIFQHRGNSRTFDFSDLTAQVDLVYIDGSHRFDDVICDSKNALRLLRPGGYIVWDDYHLACAPVIDAIDLLSKSIPIRRIAGTRLAIHGPYHPQPVGRPEEIAD